MDAQELINQTNELASKSRLKVTPLTVDPCLLYGDKIAAKSRLKAEPPAPTAVVEALPRKTKDPVCEAAVGKTYARNFSGVMGPDERYKVRAFNKELGIFEIERLNHKAVFPLPVDQFMDDFRVVANVAHNAKA